MIDKRLEDLCSLVGEGLDSNIIEYQGDYYFVGGTEDWKYSEECPLLFDESDLEENLILATRRSTGTAPKDYNQPEGYIPEKFLTVEDYKNNSLVNQGRRWVGNCANQDKSFLPDCEEAIYKEVLSHPNIDSEDHILYDEDTDKYWCIRQVCSLCESKGLCTKKLHKRKRDFRIISIDLAAQEPRCNVMNNPDEKSWRLVFQNDTLRQDKTLLLFINNLFKDHLKVNIDLDIRYQEWLDKQFFLDHTNLLRFNNAVMGCKLDNSSTNRSQLAEEIKKIEDSWHDFINNS